MYLESFHRVLKILYLNHKQNRRIDSLLVTLLRVARDKAFECLRKQEMGKKSHKICEVNKRHKRALLLKLSSAAQIENTEWKVQSQSSPDTNYVIEKAQESCGCKLQCTDCEICPHNYTCTCLDSILHATVCKHVHLVHMKYMQKDTNSISEDPTLLTDTYSYFTSLLSNKKPDTSLTQTKTSLLKKLQKLEALVTNCQNIDAIQTANRHVQAAISVITVINQQSTEKKLPVKQKVSPNQNCEHQHFFSTKKRRYSSTPTLSRPTVKEINKIEKDLESADVKFCGSCLKDDKTTV